MGSSLNHTEPVSKPVICDPILVFFKQCKADVFERKTCERKTARGGKKIMQKA
jgi:hypothetical protein